MTEKKAIVAINGAYGALELEEVIGELAKVRAGMSPAVPTRPDPARETLEQVDALFTIRALVGGGARIWLRNEGIGWLAFTLAPKDVLGLRDFLGEKIGHSYTKH